MRALPAAIAALLVVSPLSGQQQKPPDVDPARVNAAIKSGVEFLRTRFIRSHGSEKNTVELVLLTLVHAGIQKGDPLFDTLLKTLLDENLTTTYRTSLEAMALEEIDRKTYQKRIFQCAQFLVDNQCPNGQWSYGEPTTYPEPKPTPDIAVETKYAVRKQREGPDHGDNSNTQYAALGLRACIDANIIIPKEVIARAAQAWRDTQTAARGWSYGPKGNTAYGSMTAGGVAALTIYDFLQGVDWRKDEAVNGGLAWLKDNFTVVENPGRHLSHHYYYLYALGRAGRLYGTDKFGRFDWYAEGAKYLLDNQNADGSWEKRTVDTCFAVLFLRRSTRPLVASVDPK